MCTVRCWSFSAPLMVISPILFFIASCGFFKRDEGGRFGPPPEVSIVASVDGVEKEDLSRTDFQYNLVCDELGAIAGEVIEKDGQKNILFKSNLLKNGMFCSLEVRGPLDSKNEWLTQPTDEGLYYASTQEKISAAKLQPTLYKVYRLRGDDSEFVSLVVNTLEGGLCQSFSTVARRCLDDEQKPHDPGVKEPDDVEPIEDPTLKKPLQTEARTRELFGFEVIDDDRVDGFQATISGIEQTFQDDFLAPLPGSVAAELGLRNNMTILSLDKTPVTNRDEFYAEMKKILATKSGAKVLMMTKLSREPSYHMLPIPNSENKTAN